MKGSRQVQNRLKTRWVPALSDRCGDFLCRHYAGVCGFVLLLLSAGAVAQEEAGRSVDASVSFSRQILPILSDNCFHCHGPAETGRKAGLRLDTEDGITRERRGRQAVVRGDAERSELIRRIDSTDPDEVMPPHDSNRSLSDEERDLLRRWVEIGAPWGRHWAFESVQAVAPAPMDGLSRPEWVVNEIDPFIATKHQEHGLEPTPPADREQWISRVTLDLTGLPPTDSEMALYLEDTEPGADERLVDRLLSSPAYGERMAVEWMDLARYADTYGYQADVERDLSPWRDWVIRSFNENQPYSDFLRWQLAGDLMPERTHEQRLATAFNRLHRQTNEGGSIEEEWRAEYVADRVHTVGTAFLGLTLECARCHDHKYDPISQRDYYAMTAFFNSIDESGLYSHFTRAVPTPALFLYPPGGEIEHARLKSAVDLTRSSLEAALRDAGREAPPRSVLESGGVASPAARFDFSQVEGGRAISLVRSNVAEGVQKVVETGRGHAVEFNGDDAVTCKSVGRYGRTDPFSIGAWIRPAERQNRAVIWHYSQAWTDSGSRGYELLLDRGRPMWSLIHFWPGNAVSIRAEEPLPTGEMSHVLVVHDGSGTAAGLRIFVNGKPVGVEVVRDHLYLDIHHRSEWGDSSAGALSLTLGARFRDHGFKGGQLADLQVFDTALTPAEALLLAGQAPGLAGLEEALLQDHWVRRHAQSVQTARDLWLEAVRAENEWIGKVPQIMTMEALPEQRPTFVLERGEYSAPGAPVEPGVPESVFPMNPNLPRNRLGLAEWMLDPQNPLTARVWVNRIWKLHFGRGLVNTVEDFGMQSQSPTHPELLDWLAHQFMESGWDRKALHRLIVTSATYRQDSRGTGRAMSRDPENVWLARGPAHRLPAETIRDRALASSGLLVPTLGGPSVKPYQPEGVWEEAGTGKVYHQDHGDKLYRRSLYTFWRRTAPPPSMLTFDATSREVCTAKREPTATPLQALLLLNDVQYLEAARVLAEALVREYPNDVPNRIRTTFRRLLGRDPTLGEESVLAQLWGEQMTYFREDPERAEAFVQVGEKPGDSTLSAVEVAATAVLANTLMNHDGFVMKR